MAIEFSCTRCQKTIRVDPSAAGKRGKCPQCGEIVTVPQAAPSPAAAPALQPFGGLAKKPAPANLSFPCPNCRKSVSAPAALAGKRGKCPHCQATVVIGGSMPGPAATPEAIGLEPLADSSVAQPATGGDDLFADLPALAPLPALEAKVIPEGPPLNPLGLAPGRFGSAAPQPAAVNPYASTIRGEAGPATAPLKLLAPAILLFLVSLVSIGLNIYQAIDIANHPERARQIVQPETQEQARAIQLGFTVGGIGGALLAIVLNACIMLSAVLMIRMRDWSKARMGAIAAIIPCCSPLCLSVPLGIWALVVLHQADVRQQFR
jgi:hypothetical protein